MSSPANMPHARTREAAGQAGALAISILSIHKRGPAAENAVRYRVMVQVFQENGALIKAWIDGVPLEDAARKQLLNVAALPFIHHHIAAMPDVHWGMGATVGSVIPTKGAIVPAAVGGGNGWGR